jgi:hypothetical protein
MTSPTRLLAVIGIVAVLVGCTAAEPAPDNEPVAPPETTEAPTTTSLSVATSTALPSTENLNALYRIDRATLEQLPASEPLSIGDWAWGISSENGSWLALRVGTEENQFEEMHLVGVVIKDKGVLLGLRPKDAAEFWIEMGPVFKYSETDTVPGHYLSDTRPYGIGEFGQAGFRVGIYKDSRIRAKDAYRGFLVDLSATVYPVVADVTSQFEVYSLATAAYFTFPVIKRPFLSLKAGAKKVHGDFPFHEAAFVGGEPSERKLPYQRYGGDEAVYGSAELRIPVVGFPLILPIDIGVYVYGNSGRVYVDRQSPDGWHTSRGAGAWIGILNPSSGVEVDLGNYVGRNIVQAKIGFSF